MTFGKTVLFLDVQKILLTQRFPFTGGMESRDGKHHFDAAGGHWLLEDDANNTQE